MGFDGCPQPEVESEFADMCCLFGWNQQPIGGCLVPRDGTQNPVPAAQALRPQHSCLGHADLFLRCRLGSLGHGQCQYWPLITSGSASTNSRAAELIAAVRSFFTHAPRLSLSKPSSLLEVLPVKAMSDSTDAKTSRRVESKSTQSEEPMTVDTPPQQIIEAD